MKKILLFTCLVSTMISFSQVGINTTNPTATLHIFGSTTPGSSGGTVNLINEDFSSYTVTQNHTTDSDCTGNATQGWVTGTGNTNVNCTSCTGTWLFISSDALNCGLNSTAIMNFTTAPTTTSISISFAYRYNNFGAAPDSFRAYLYNNTTSSQVGANFFNLTADANTTYSGTATVVPGNSYSLRFEYQGNYDYGASVDNVLVTETATASPGTYSFRLEDGTQGVGKVLTSDADGNGYWQTPTGGGSGTDSQTLSIVGNDLTISNGNTVTLPSGGSGSYTFTNGLTLTSSTVRLGGTLTQGTTLNLDTNDLTFSSSTSAAFPGEMIIQGTDRKIMDTRFDDNYIHFGDDAFLDSDDGTTFNDTGSTTFTKDFVAGFSNSNSGGSAVAIGSIEYFVDGTNELFFEGSGFNPMTDETSSFGNTLGKTNRRWGAVYATNGVITTSDMNLKTNVQPLTYGLKELLKLNTITYNWKNYKLGKTTIPLEKQEKKIGFSAQQLLEILPEVVQTHSWVPVNENGDYKEVKNEHLGVNYSDIIPVTVKAIQEQQAQIEELKKEIDELKLLIKELKK
ncbi:tail fiber domain-containing protein [Flavobacterium cyclinae]|uniref:tail fiber domain-containing protein n=1 Tax=Flavobacterium cyclinae TaxID=2895947 RepID=UPI001E32129E|nr:tail fiber domain-containing protein [Flavobacterium cyclinae]UGS21132.1 tail fiber domain-containing protein [Flavobacterium cyclinae]